MNDTCLSCLCCYCKSCTQSWPSPDPVLYRQNPCCVHWGAVQCCLDYPLFANNPPSSWMNTISVSLIIDIFLHCCQLFTALLHVRDWTSSMYRNSHPKGNHLSVQVSSVVSANTQPITWSLSMRFQRITGHMHVCGGGLFVVSEWRSIIHLFGRKGSRCWVLWHWMRAL